MNIMRVPAVKAAAVRGLACAPTNCRDGCTYLGRDRRHPFCCAAMAARKVAMAVIAEPLPTLPRRVSQAHLKRHRRKPHLTRIHLRPHLLSLRPNQSRPRWHPTGPKILRRRRIRSRTPQRNAKLGENIRGGCCHGVVSSVFSQPAGSQRDALRTFEGL